MVRSKLCNLYGLSSKQLVSHREESEEIGGYFITNGIERLIRTLIVPRSNYPLALMRNTFIKRGPLYTKYGIEMRCLRPDMTSKTIRLHYRSDGNILLRVHIEKAEYLIPVMMVLNALVETSDKEVYDEILRGREDDDGLLSERVGLLLSRYHKFELFSQKHALEYIGAHFRDRMKITVDTPMHKSGREFLRRFILVHLSDDEDKFRCLLVMIRKLYALVSGECLEDSADSTQNHELLLSGHLMAAAIKERVDEYLSMVQRQFEMECRKSDSRADFLDQVYVKNVLEKVNSNIGNKMQNFMSTGNLNTRTGMDLQQTSGFTIVAEKINFYRYLSHFRSVHRGAFFAQLRTTAVRKLLPESWGFLCPVHTPDGSPCGLLMHLAHKCEVVTIQESVQSIPSLLYSLGVSPQSSVVNKECQLPVMLDGRLIGWCTDALAKYVSKVLRHWKVTKEKAVPKSLEIGYIPENKYGQYPGLFLFSNPSRMTRPVKHLESGENDYVGPFEQVYMDIACQKEDIVKDVTTHIEYDPTNMLSIVANMTPFSDFNQSPRNMYQCQMAKQTVGIPGVAHQYRNDVKDYQLQTPQVPIVRPKLHDKYGMDNFPLGTNAIVAVISYTGYDMEDAMIINKSSHERGFGYVSIFKTITVDLIDLVNEDEKKNVYFGFGANPTTNALQQLDHDGLPYVGARLKEGDIIAAYHVQKMGTDMVPVVGDTKMVYYKGTEEGYVDDIRYIGSEASQKPCRLVQIKVRVPRPTVIGDKWSSRHGQKGVCSQKWPSIDMPFSESGIQPDIIINPHAFPSRMTIGMFIESLAGKAGVLHAKHQDSTPFIFDEKRTAANFFGEQLKNAGYNFHGNEPMYSGITGTEFHADIYLGVVYYQRLRHMVSDKYQVRSTGPVHNITRQPVKGRKRGGGIRFGEMERDSIIAHGASFFLQDRLMNNSDYSTAYVCRDCGSMLGVINAVIYNGADLTSGSERCRQCATEAVGADRTGETWQDGLGNVLKGGGNVGMIALPHVFKYLAAELAAMGLTMTMKLK